MENIQHLLWSDLSKSTWAYDTFPFCYYSFKNTYLFLPFKIFVKIIYPERIATACLEIQQWCRPPLLGTYSLQAVGGPGLSTFPAHKMTLAHVISLTCSQWDLFIDPSHTDAPCKQQITESSVVQLQEGRLQSGLGSMPWKKHLLFFLKLSSVASHGMPFCYENTPTLYCQNNNNHNNL